MQDLNPTQTETIGGGVAKQPPLTTLAIGEEGGMSRPFGEDFTTMAFGEEGCIPPKLPILSASALGSF